MTQTCGSCSLYGPLSDHHGLCGGVLPRVEYIGMAAPKGSGTGEPEPMWVTLRPEVGAMDPGCYRWTPDGATQAAEPTGDGDTVSVPVSGQPTADPGQCKAPGCNCRRDGDSLFCADHEVPYEITVDEETAISETETEDYP